MSIRNAADLQGIRRAGRVVADALAAMRSATRAGITTRELDEFGADVLRRHGARSAPQLVYGFPGVNLICVNDEIVHGIPGDRRLRPGDVVKLDVTAELDGYIADAAATVIVPPAEPIARRLRDCAMEAFKRGVEAASVGRPVRAIGAAVEQHVRSCGFSVVRELGARGREDHPRRTDRAELRRSARAPTTHRRPGSDDRAAHLHRRRASRPGGRWVDDPDEQWRARRAL